MIEKYIEITCDGCGEIEWSPANVPMSEFKTDYIPSWKHRGAKDLCPKCVDRGIRWKDAKLHEAAP